MQILRLEPDMETCRAGGEMMFCAPKTASCSTALSFSRKDISSAFEYIFSDTKFDQGFARLLNRPRHSVGLVAELDGKLVGGVWATAGEYLFGEGVVCTTVHTIIVDDKALSPIRRAKAFLKLIKGLRAWSKTRNSKRIMVHVTTGQKLAATDRLLKAAGMRMVGGGYVG